MGWELSRAVVLTGRILFPGPSGGYLVMSSGISGCHKLGQVLLSPGMRGRIGTQHPPVYVCDDERCQQCRI